MGPITALVESTLEWFKEETDLDTGKLCGSWGLRDNLLGSRGVLCPLVTETWWCFEAICRGLRIDVFTFTAAVVSLVEIRIDDGGVDSKA
mmetsp:Transcript_5789/g.9655  ORF Transcript_5789/g.9655 Transcript_5789/m.9655 type:complete len:90 (+) Transcript_5789:319-588(+)